MKRLAILVVALALVIGGSLAASAQEFEINVNGGFQFGSYKATESAIDVLSSTANGFVLGVDTTIAGPIGAQFKLESLSESDLKLLGSELASWVKQSGFVLKMDFLGTYALPLNFDQVNLRGVFGYTTTNTKSTMDGSDYSGSKLEISTKYSGIPVGVQADFALTD